MCQNIWFLVESAHARVRSPRRACGRGRIVLAIRVRGTLRESEPDENPPHPNPLPARGKREQWSIAVAPYSKLTPFQSGTRSQEQARPIWQKTPQGGC